jgi:hypothetical protein
MQDKTANQEIDGVLTEALFARNHSYQIEDGGNEIDQKGDFEEQDIDRHDGTSRIGRPGDWAKRLRRVSGPA